MKLSTKTRYAARFLLHLALHKEQAPIMLKQVAGSEGISEKYLSQIAIPLKAQGLIGSMRGAGGGYFLARPASEIRLREVVELFEEGMEWVECGRDRSVCRRAPECIMRDVWHQFSETARQHLDQITLADLVQRIHQHNQPLVYNI
jgi:Rrf2 family iron-sulfur cluster assembly transcriptional regulator